MPPCLFEPRAKCAWAKRHLDDPLKVHIEGFGKDNPYKIEGEIDVHSSQHVVKITHPDILQAIPIVMILGDFAENLRTSLTPATRPCRWGPPMTCGLSG